MAAKPPTVRSLNARLDGVEQKLSGVAENVSDVQASIQKLGEETAEQYTQLWSALDRVSGGVAENVSDVQASIQKLGEETAEQYTRLWGALAAVGGLDEIGRGLSEIGEVLAPMRQFALPSTAEPLGQGVAEALETIRSALGDRRDLNFTNLVTQWDGPVGFIGEPVPEAHAPAGYAGEE